MVEIVWQVLFDINSSNENSPKKKNLERWHVSLCNKAEWYCKKPGTKSYTELDLHFVASQMKKENIFPYEM